MSLGTEAAAVGQVKFTGTRSDLLGLLVRGYLLMLPTLGIYRFWLTTAKRRFYWQNTLIDGDPLEYTGTPIQLLIGFLFALAFFLPIYIGFFYLSTQTSDIIIIGYAIVGAVLWLLTGYAIYKARDFRLSRTLWRGIRFDQKGSAWGYAFRRFGWSILMVLTAGLVYPFMVTGLFRHRNDHTWFGDRRFSFHGSWKLVAGPFYLVYFGVLVLAGLTVAVAASEGGSTLVEGVLIPSAPVWLLGLATALGLFCGIYYYKSRVTSRLLSAVRVGEARLHVRLRARALVGQLLLYCLSVTGAGIVFLMFIGIIIGGMFGSAFAEGRFDAESLGSLLQVSWVNIIVLILAYLVGLATLALLGELFLGYGYWMLVARGASIANAEDLRSVRASGEDTALAGEGLADALNVGAY